MLTNALELFYRISFLVSKALFNTSRTVVWCVTLGNWISLQKAEQQWSRPLATFEQDNAASAISGLMRNEESKDYFKVKLSGRRAE
jgi:hypothetical protein